LAHRLTAHKIATLITGMGIFIGCGYGSQVQNGEFPLPWKWHCSRDNDEMLWKGRQ